jgi:magnesium transporter
MIRNLTQQRECNFDWIDITDPQPGELEGIAHKYNLHEASVHDCLQPGHLPKYEKIRNYTFIIIRVFSESDIEADTVQELTNKIAIFISEKFIITIHRRGWAPIQLISGEYMTENKCEIPAHLLTEIVKAGLRSYDEPGQKLTQSIEYYETQVFLAERNVSLLKGLYFIKRKVDVIRRLLLLTYDIIEEVDNPETSNAHTRDMRDLYIKEKSFYDSLSENTHQLLNIYFNVAAQRTNEIMRVLTVFSAFFLPLTFIVGIYGMNFQFMPELAWHYGYLFSGVLMAVVVIFIFVWFRKKKWL